MYVFVYNKPHPDYMAAKPDYIMAADSLFNQYTNNTVKSKDYTGKIIQIKGNAKRIELTDSLSIVIFVFKQGDFGDEGIRCTLHPKQSTTAIQIEQNKFITLKGLCTGYNGTDVIFEKCSFIN